MWRRCAAHLCHRLRAVRPATTRCGRGRAGAWHGSGGDAGLVTEGAGGLHAEQHFVYHRPVRVGDVMVGATRPGEEWEKHGRSGRLRFREQITEFRDEAGELVVTARSVSVQREAS